MADDPTLRPPTLLHDARRARTEIGVALDAADCMAAHVSRLLEAACLGERRMHRPQATKRAPATTRRRPT